ncbi:hypothetical protein CYMTET_53177 [Cymbomonas tetramitiformis]|uniref:Mitochondrial splicing suppressor 51-like C-terminal domain-containing protein n=1 Tax=Cymbomonas tetramitiformis TaxID=36881 RepID=A0AAE0EQ05_9CHLO|nr:hypothetical protein CYMTET_53177 [Cymbomonas tetramitiformis]
MEVGALVEIFGLVGAKQHNGSVAKVLSEEDIRFGVQVLYGLYGPAPKKRLSVKPTNLKPLSPALLKAVEGEELFARNDVSDAAEWFAVTGDGHNGARETIASLSSSAASDKDWPRENSIVYTIALVATALREQIGKTCAARADGRFVLHLLGCRWHVEGSIDVKLLIKVLRRVARFDKLCLVFIGPELADVDREVQESFKRAVKENEVVIEVNAQPAEMLPAQGEFLLSTESSVERPDLAVILNGGLDDNFGSWASTLWRLLAQGIPAAFTGYGGTDGSVSETDVGTEAILQLLGANFVAPCFANPFRFSHPFSPVAADAFILLTCGGNNLVPGKATTMREVQRKHRLVRLEHLAKLNIRSHRDEAAAKLRDLRSALEAGTVTIPPAVSFADMEQWSYGMRPKKW